MCVIGSLVSPYKTYDLGPSHNIETLVVDRGKVGVSEYGAAY